MIEKDEGIIIFSKKIKDNDLFLKILSSNDKIVPGIVYGGNSAKKKLIYQIGYFIEFTVFQKNENIVPTINAEITKPFINNIIQDKYKSYSLLCIISLVNLSIIEGQKIKGLYKSIRDIVKIIGLQKNWISFFCEWLFTLLKMIGYQIDYKNKYDYKYFNLITQEFENIINENSINFPHQMLKHTNKVNFYDVNAIFIIFESIYTNNHLNNMNFKIPIHFINFKTVVLRFLKNHA